MRRSTVITAALEGAAASLGILMARSWYLGWGSTATEREESLPGDDLIRHADLTATRAITIHQPAERIWPWLAQLGQGKGGFYSYDFLENLFGHCDIHSADRIMPEWQDIKAGGSVSLAPGYGLAVASAVPPWSLVLHGGVPIGEKGPPFDFTWAYVLHARPDGSTRLVVRERYAYTRLWARALVEPVEAVSFVMHQKMLRGIRDRAESASAAG